MTRARPKPRLAPRTNSRSSLATRTALERALRNAADPKRAISVAKFFKTGKGEYGEGDRFIGIPAPVLRKIARQHLSLTFADLHQLLSSPIHEYRSAALEILVAQYARADEARRERIVDFYLRHTRRMNNWDLVDASAPYILGQHLLTRSRKVLYELAASPNLWERRIAVIATLALVRGGDVAETLRIAEKLLDDRHDLIHKALGWALRETGKVSTEQLVAFLQRHYERLPRTTLRYAIERFPLRQREQFLAGKLRQT